MGMGWVMAKASPKFIKREVNTVAIIASGEAPSAKKWKKIAVEVADLFVRRKWTMLYCGMGGGLAGAIATHIIKNGGDVTGVLVEGQIPPDVPEGVGRIMVKDFHERKRALFDHPDGILILPGGIGTLAEFSEMVVWYGVGLLNKPLVLYDPDNWFDPIIQFYEKARRHKLCPIPVKKLFLQGKSINSVSFLLSRKRE